MTAHFLGVFISNIIAKTDHESLLKRSVIECFLAIFIENIILDGVFPFLEDIFRGPP